MKLKKCPSCKNYTLKKKCLKCSKETKDANYKFIKTTHQKSINSLHN